MKKNSYIKPLSAVILFGLVIVLFITWTRPSRDGLEWLDPRIVIGANRSDRVVLYIPLEALGIENQPGAEWNPERNKIRFILEKASGTVIETANRMSSLESQGIIKPIDAPNDVSASLLAKGDRFGPSVYYSSDYETMGQVYAVECSERYDDATKSAFKERLRNPCAAYRRLPGNLELRYNFERRHLPRWKEIEEKVLVLAEQIRTSRQWGLS